MNRSTADLVTELKDTAGEITRACLVVGFDDHTEFVWADEPEPLASLNRHVEAGGEPVALVGIHEGEVKARPLAEYAEEEWVEKFLFTLLAQLRRDLGREQGK